MIIGAYGDCRSAAMETRGWEATKKMEMLEVDNTVLLWQEASVVMSGSERSTRSCYDRKQVLLWQEAGVVMRGQH